MLMLAMKDIRKEKKQTRRNNFSKKEKEKWEKTGQRRKEKNEFVFTLKWAPPNSLPCPPRPKKENRPFYNKNFSIIFCGFWRVLGRLEKEKKKKKKKMEKRGKMEKQKKR